MGRRPCDTRHARSALLEREGTFLSLPDMAKIKTNSSLRVLTVTGLPATLLRPCRWHLRGYEDDDGPGASATAPHSDEAGIGDSRALSGGASSQDGGCRNPFAAPKRKPDVRRSGPTEKGRMKRRRPAKATHSSKWFLQACSLQAKTRRTTFKMHYQSQLRGNDIWGLEVRGGEANGLSRRGDRSPPAAGALFRTTPVF